MPSKPDQFLRLISNEAKIQLEMSSENFNLVFVPWMVLVVWMKNKGYERANIEDELNQDKDFD